MDKCTEKVSGPSITNLRLLNCTEPSRGDPTDHYNGRGRIDLPRDDEQLSQDMFGNQSKNRKVDDFLSIDDETLINTSTKQLNKMLRGNPKDFVQVVKCKRRTLKNRGYANITR